MLGPRLRYPDNLRILLIVLVIMTHAAVTYSSLGAWYYHEGGATLVTDIPLAWFMGVNQSFFMGLFFAIAGYFTPGSFDRKGAKKFMKDRLVRLGVPIIFYMLFIQSWLDYVPTAIKYDSTPSWAGYVGQLPQMLGYFSPGPTWFLLLLLIFSGVYAWIRLGTGAPESRQPSVFSGKSLALFIAGLAAATILVRLGWSTDFRIPHTNIQPALMPQFASFFILGIAAFRRGWLEVWPERLSGRVKWVAAGLVLMWPVILIGAGALTVGTEVFLQGPHWQMLLYSVWEVAAGICISIFLISLFRKKFSRQNAVTKAMSDGVFAVYIFHPPILVALALAMRDLAWHPLIKFALLVAFGATACFAFAHFVVLKLPGARKIL